MALTLRAARPDDAPALARMSIENSRHYARAAPELFRVPDEGAVAELLANDEEWRSKPENLALVAEVDGQVAGYLEASLQEPEPTAPAQSNPDLALKRLFINYVGTADAYKRQGVATALVTKAEAWAREQGAKVAVCDTWIESDLSMPFWEERMGYARRAVIFRKQL